MCLNCGHGHVNRQYQISKHVFLTITKLKSASISQYLYCVHSPLAHLDDFEHCRYVPDMSEKAELARAGLGEKSISLFYYAEADELYSELQMHYPQLGNGGGYEMLTVGDRGGKELKVLAPSPGGYTTEFLKSCVTSAKLYIRPLQTDLELDTGHSREVN